MVTWTDVIECAQCPAVHTGPNQSPSTILCVLDRCQLLAHPFFPFINALINLESGQNWLTNTPITDQHLHIFAKQIHSVGVTFGPLRIKPEIVDRLPEVK